MHKGTPRLVLYPRGNVGETTSLSFQILRIAKVLPVGLVCCLDVIKLGQAEETKTKKAKWCVIILQISKILSALL